MGALHFITLNVRDRKTPFSCPEYATMILELLMYGFDRHPAKLIAYGVMPDHLHCLLELDDGKVTDFLRRFKPNGTRNLDALATRNNRQNDRDWLCQKGKRELWQDGKYSIALYSPEWIKQKLEYIHNNPVRSGLVEHPGDHPYSSFGAYYPELGIEPIVKVDLLEF